jgi:adenosine deaminase
MPYSLFHHLLDQERMSYDWEEEQREALIRWHHAPKTELHVHVEGATSPETFWHLAQKNNVPLPARRVQDWTNYFQFRDFFHFIEVYTTASACIQRPEDYTILLRDFFRHQAGQGITYTEAFISCSLSIHKFPASDWLDALAQGLQEGHAETGIDVRLIADMSRELPHTQDTVLDFALKGHQRGVFVGLGLGGLENGFPARLYEDMFREAQKAGLGLTVHAGEAEGPESMWEALELLHAKRLGHGIRVFEDPLLVDALRTRNIPLEVSPTSNYCTNVVAAQDRHPLHRMVEVGIPVVLNTDDPQMFDTYYLHECALLLKQGMPVTSVDSLIQEAGQYALTLPEV